MNENEQLEPQVAQSLEEAAPEAVIDEAPVVEELMLEETPAAAEEELTPEEAPAAVEEEPTPEEAPAAAMEELTLEEPPAVTMEELTPEKIPATEAPAKAPQAARSTPEKAAPVKQPPVKKAPAQVVAPQLKEFPTKPVRPVAPVKAQPPQQAKPPVAMRILMQLLSLVLCLVLMVGLLATAVLLDLKTLTSSGSIKTIITSFISGSSNTAPYASTVRTGSAQVLPMAEVGGYQIPDNIDFSSDILTDPDALAEYIYDVIQDTMGEDIEITQEQVQDFIDNSTVTDYVADKAASYVDDLLSGEENTTITIDEIMDLLDENQALIEETFDVTITQEMKEDIRTQIEDTVDEEAINSQIRQAINEVKDTPIEGTNYSVNDILQLLGTLTQTSVILSAVGLCLVLMLILLALNYYCLPGGLAWSGAAFLIIGLPLSAILLVAQYRQDLVAQLVPQLAPSTVANIVTVFQPVHYGMTALGAVLVIGSIVWSILAHNAREGKTSPSF